MVTEHREVALWDRRKLDDGTAEPHMVTVVDLRDQDRAVVMFENNARLTVPRKLLS